eukprot:4024932-Pyramimonas_sp.AAC.1
MKVSTLSLSQPHVCAPICCDGLNLSASNTPPACCANRPGGDTWKPPVTRKLQRTKCWRKRDGLGGCIAGVDNNGVRTPGLGGWTNRQTPSRPGPRRPDCFRPGCTSRTLMLVQTSAPRP